MSSESIPQVLVRRAAENADRTLITEADGGSITYGEFLHESKRWAAALEQLGVGSGDRVVTMLEPLIESFCAWFGMAWLGAIDTACNTQYRGSMLAYLINDAEADIALVDRAHVSRFVELGEAVARLRTVVVCGAASDEALPASEHFEVVAAAHLLAGAEAREVEPPQVADTALILYTSGTTGPSKGVMLSWGMLRHMADALSAAIQVGPDDVYYSPYPIYHGNGRAVVPNVIVAGGQVVLRRHFSASDFWDDIRRFGCTLTTMLGPIAGFLWSQPASSEDRDNPLRQVVMLPVLPDYQEFAERFDVKLQTMFGMSEIGVAFMSGSDIANARSCGRPRPGYHLRLVDANGNDVEVGEVGELVVRHDDRLALSTGYFNLPEATEQAWRDGWFHTGDAFRADADGNYYFVDRIKDSIRRRGENISSFEVEALVLEHDAVAEVAAIAVPSDVGEDEVKICVVLQDGATIGAGELVSDLVPVMPRFMVPRYVEFVDSLPRTDATQRVRKVALREDPLNEATWDREASEMVL